MSEPYLGQIEIFAFDFPPRGWALCAGQILPISTNQALFSVLGTTYGGNGQTTFALPDLRGRVAIGQGNNAGQPAAAIGQTGGEETHTLTIAETPIHTHTLAASANANPANNSYTPANNEVLTRTTGQDQNGNSLIFNIYTPDQTPAQTLDSTAAGVTGGQPHSNMMPFVSVNFCIALTGVYPLRT